MSISRKLHQIWLGPHPEPTKWMDTWRVMNPDLEYRVWRDFKGFRFEKKMRRFMRQKRYSIVADIMRMEILYQHGGVYMDADSICRIPIQNASFMKSDFFAVLDFTGYVANGVIGCKPKHPIIKECLEHIDKHDDYWEYGARMLTQHIGYRDIRILPTYAFYPRSWTRRLAVPIGIKYAEQMWCSTRKKW